MVSGEGRAPALITESPAFHYHGSYERVNNWDGPHRECFFFYQRELQERAKALLDHLQEVFDPAYVEPLIDAKIGETRCPACGRIVRLERQLSVPRWIVRDRDGRQHWCPGAPVAPSAIAADDRRRGGQLPRRVPPLVRPEGRPLPAPGRPA
jgi:hypothetical protein